MADRYSGVAFGCDRSVDRLRMTRFRTFARRSDGASAIEFALVCPVLLLLLLGAIDFGMVVFAKNVTQDAARVVVRDLSTNKITTSQASAEAKSLLPSWVSSKVTVTVAQTAPSDSSKNEFTLTIAFDATKVALTGFFNDLFGSTKVASHSTMHQEPPL
jgi:Flp pilus assembly protein TadG